MRTGRRRRTGVAVLKINTTLLVRKKKLIRTEHPCKIKNPIQYLSNKMDVSNLDIQYIDNDEASEDLSVVERELNEDYQPKSVKSG